MKTPNNSTLSKRSRLPALSGLSLAAALLVPAATSFGQAFWSGGASDYNVGASWGGSVPAGNAANDSGSNNVVLIQPGDPVWGHGDTLAAQGDNTSGAYLQTGSTNNTGYPSGGSWLRLGIGNGSLGYYVLSNGTLNVAGRTQLGEHGYGQLEIDNGVYNTGFNGNPGLVAGQGDFGLSSGTLIINGGAVTNVNNETWFGEGNGCVGYLIMNGGAFKVNNWFVFGRNSGQGYGTMTGGTLTLTGGGQFLVGGGGVGSLIQSGGTINVYNQYLVPESGNATVHVGTNTLSGTAVLNAHNWLAVGRNGGRGELNLSGGAVITRDSASDGGSHFDIGASGIGTVNQNGGFITNTTSALYLGESGAGKWNVNSGTDILASVVMCVNSSASGVLNLNGGLFQTTGISSPSPAAVSLLSLNGGTLQANANNASFIAGLSSASLASGGVTIDSQSYNITIPQALTDAGGGSLTKVGNGALTLTGANSYTGNTVINGGSLTIGSSATGAGNVTAADGTGFGVVVQSAGSTFNANNLSLGVTSGATLTFDLGNFGNPASAPLNVANTLTANGTISVNIKAAVISAGTIPLLQYASLTGSPTYVLASLPPGVVATLATAGNVLNLVVTSAGAPRWDGNVSGVWSFGTNQDWYDLATLGLTVYTDGKPVIFDDNAAGTTTVNLTATVAPASLNFNNSTLPYTIAGTGKIGGNLGLNLNGSTNVSILNTGGNTFTGPVVINGGTLTVTNLANGGSPSPLGASSANPTNLVLNGGTLQYSGAPVAANRGFTVAATNSTIDTEGNLTLGGNVAAAANIAGGGSGFLKTGPAQLRLTAAGNNEFANGRNPGVQVINGSLVLDGSAGNQTNHTVNDCYVGSTPDTGAALILTNSLLNVDGWFALGRINGGLNNTSTVSLYNSALNVGNLSIGWDGNQGGNLAAQFLTLNGSSTLTNYGAVNLPEGNGSSMTLTIQDSSVFSVRNPAYIALANSSTGAVVVANSASLVSSSGWFDIAQGNNSVGSVLVKDNARITTTGDFNVTDTGTGATASFTAQDNAYLYANNLFVGKATGDTASFTINNHATVVSGNGITLATHFDGTPEVCTANVNLNGGSLTVNLVQGNSVAGTYYGNFNFNGGKLIAHPTVGYSGQNFMYNLAAINVLAGGANLEVDNNNISAINQPLLGGTAAGGLTKLGTGTLYLNAVNTYTNTTTISAGTLSGTGTLVGPVNVAAGGSLGAGAGAIGLFNINNALTFATGAAAVLKITPASNDSIQGLTSVAYNGSLIVSNTSSSPLVVGHSYTLFNSANPGTGNFTSVTVLPAGSGTFNPATGVLTITSNGSSLTVNPVTSVGGNLILTGSGGAPGGSYSVLTATNLTTPVAAWTTNTTGTFSGGGSFSNGIPVNPAQPAAFFRIKTP